MTAGKNNYLKYFGYIFRRVLKYKRTLVVSYGVLIIITGFLPQIEAFITGKLIDKVLTHSQGPREIIPAVLIVILLMWGMRLFYDLQSYITQNFNYRMQSFSDELYFSTVVGLPPHVYDDAGFIALKNIMDYNLWKLNNLIFWTLSILGAIFTNAFLVVIFLSYSPVILLSVLVSLIFPSIVRFKYGKRVWGIWDSLSDKKIIFRTYRSPLYQDEADKFTETKVFNYGPYLIRKLLAINNGFLDNLVNNEKKRLIFTTVARIFEYVCVGFGYWMVISLVLNKSITIGSLYFLLTMYGALRNSTSFTLEQVTNVMADGPFMKSLYEFCTYEPAYKVVSGTTILETKAPSIEFRDVWFKYPGTEKWVLKGVSLKIQEKTDVAFVGKNGAGKSTLIKLILRVYDATKGEILINGINIKNISIPEYYKQIGILAQEFHKFGFTAGENITIGDVHKTQQTEELMVEAAKKARADDFINQYEHGYNTYLTRELKGGVNPSGGQTQRIAIARVFYKNPSLIILDEPTSAIDSLAEEQIFGNIKQESVDKTVVIISHRFATVKKADYIFVLDEGIIKEQGTHQELCANNGLYAQMYTTQIT